MNREVLGFENSKGVTKFSGFFGKSGIFCSREDIGEKGDVHDLYYLTYIALYKY